MRMVEFEIGKSEDARGSTTIRQFSLEDATVATSLGSYGRDDGHRGPMATVRLLGAGVEIKAYDDDAMEIHACETPAEVREAAGRVLLRRMDAEMLLSLMKRVADWAAEDARADAIAEYQARFRELAGL